MNIKATSVGKKVDLRHACGRFEARAASNDEAYFLAALHNVLVAGGTIVISPNKTAQKMCSFVGKFTMKVPEQKQLQEVRMSEQKAVCELCGEPMPPGEEMLKFHGYSGPCPKPPLPKADVKICPLCGKPMLPGERHGVGLCP